VQRLFSEGLEASIGVARCNVSILFCDIDGFEEACAGLVPTEVLRLLSSVLGKIADVIELRQGTLLEFIGDEVLAVFNTPNFLKHHVYAALVSATEIHRVIDKMPKMTLQQHRKASGCREISVQCRIGVHTADIFAGNIGARKRMKYGMLGDGVNLAARLKSLNSRYRTRTLVSADVIRHPVSTHFVWRPVDVVAVKGKKQPTVVYEVLGDVLTADDKIKEAAVKHNEAFKLYQERNFNEAAKRFWQVSGVLANCGRADCASSILLNRCRGYIDEPPPADWDGVERLNRKSWEVATSACPPMTSSV